jgi:hypothetical protein
MKKLLLLLLLVIPFISHAQQHDMSYLTFTKYIKLEMTEDEYKSIDEFFGGNISGIVCFYDYGEFSGDDLDEFVVLTYEQSQDINVYIFSGNEKGTFDFVDKVNYPYWKSRYEVATLMKRGLLYVTSTDPNYRVWTWNKYQVKNGKLAHLGEDTYHQ